MQKRRSKPTQTSPRTSRLTTPRPSRPRRLAVTGGIGAGKSEALEAFCRHGAAVFSSDEAVHRLYADDADVRSALEARFGTTDRERIAEIVFSNEHELAWLEELVHPRVRAAYAEWLDTVDAPVAVVEIPLLYETGAEAAFDVVVVITAPEDVRRARRGHAVDMRSARLLADDEKVRRADFSYVNDGTLEQLDAFVQAILGQMST